MSSINGTESSNDLPEEQVLQTQLTDETYEELATLEGCTVLGVSFWDSSLVDELEEEIPTDEERAIIDLDLYLDDQTLLELYGAQLFPREQSEPLVGLQALEQALVELVDGEGELSEVAQTEEGTLALVFADADGKIGPIITVGAWAVSEWEELPEE
jgi:hypothetical protein